MHQIIYRCYDGNDNCQKIEAELNELARYESDGGCGLGRSISWNKSKVFESFKAAKQYIEDNFCNGRYEQVAVMYREPTKPSAKLTQLQERLKVAHQRWEKLVNADYFASLTSTFVSCPKCGSKLNREYLMRTHRKCYCPLCSVDMRPITTKNRILAAEAAYHKVEEQIEEEMKKIGSSSRNSKLMWLVKVEYHV